MNRQDNRAWLLVLPAMLLVMDTWHWLGLVVVLSYAGLSAISPAYRQAAAIDGASRWRCFGTSNCRGWAARWPSCCLWPRRFC